MLILFPGSVTKQSSCRKVMEIPVMFRENSAKIFVNPSYSY